MVLVLPVEPRKFLFEVDVEVSVDSVEEEDWVL